MRQTILILAVLALIVAACAPAQSPLPQAPQVPNEQPPAAEPSTPTPEDAEPLAPTNAEVKALFDKSSQVKSYSFDAVILPSKVAFATYSVRGDLAKIQLINPVQMNGFSADYIYVDYAKKIANGYCIELAQCKKDKKVGPVDFATYGIPLPLDWQDAIMRGEKVKSLTFDMRPVTIVTWDANNVFYEAYVDNYYGFPLHVASASDREMTEIASGNEYRAMAFNNVKEADVTQPW